MCEHLRGKAQLGEKLVPNQRSSPVANIALAEPERPGINCDREHAKPCRSSPSKGCLSRFASADEIKLIPPGPCASRGHVLQTTSRDGGQSKPHTRFRGCPRPAHFASWIYQTAETDGCQEEGHGEV